MLNNNLIKKRYFIIVYIVFSSILYLGITNSKDKTIESYLDARTNLIELEYKVLYNYHKTIADLIFNIDINKRKVIELFKDRKRLELYNYLEDSYSKLRTLSVRQLHFHLPNNDSFLRMHRPNKFGDNLSKDRLTVKYTNEHKKYISGFEEGKIFNGFRFVYPVYDKQEYIGSVEVSFSALAFIKSFVDQYKMESNFLIDKSVVSQKVFDDEKSNYIQSPLNNYYYQKSIVKYLDINLSKKSISQNDENGIEKNIKKGQSFSIYDSEIEKIITLIPLKNPITGDVVASLLFYSSSIVVQKEHKSMMIIFLISTSIIGLLLLLLYKELRAKKELEIEVKNRTKELLELNNKLAEMANTDTLTGVKNRRYFYDVIEEIISLSKRDNLNLSLAMIDIDKFKDVNDTYGHDKGDEVLKSLVDEINNNIRESDIFIRFGGEEFLLVFPNTNLRKALLISEKLRKIVEKSNNIDIKFTISIGVAEFILANDTIETVVKEQIQHFIMLKIVEEIKF